MDSYFKAAVCDLDKLLDDFELNSEEPTVYPFSSAPSSWPSSETSTVSTNLPNLNLLHYDSPTINHNHSYAADEAESKLQPLTAVDLLSSVSGQRAKPDAPPCPDRALKPVCDLVNDTSSAILTRAGSHDAFGELDEAERQLEQEEQEKEEEEALLVDFGGNSDADGCERSVDDETEKQVSHLASLDIILPLAAEQSSETVQDALRESNRCEEATSRCHAQERGLDKVPSVEEIEKRDDKKEENNVDSCEEIEEEFKKESSDYQSIGLSCLPLAVSMCGALVNNTEHDNEQAAEHDDNSVSESTEADRLSPAGDLDLGRDSGDKEPSVSLCTDHARLSPVGATSESLSRPLPDPSNQRSVNPPDFGFEYLPESDRAEMLVTDEELDAFLQAHNESEGVESVSCGRSVDSLVPTLVPEACLGVEKQRKGENGEILEGISSPESDRATLDSVEGNLNLGALSDACSSPSSDSLSTSNAFPSQHSVSAEHGGARPKTIHCQSSRSSSPPPPPPPAEEEEEEEEGLDQDLNVYTTPADIPSSPTEDSSDFRECSSVHGSQDRDSYCPGYDELSEPPPYPEVGTQSAEFSADGKTEGEAELGSKQPAWVPDADAPNCMNCSQRFTFTRRRHHCRACGKVFCGVCCNRKCKLKYLEKEARVCVVCFESIRRAEALERMMSPTGPSPNPNVPSEYCSTIPPLQQARAAGTLNSPPPTVMVPVSVLKQPATDSCPREHKRVWFADGILPNGEFADTTKLSVTTRRSGDSTPDHTPSPAGSDPGGDDPVPPEVGSEVENPAPLSAGPWDVALLSAIGSSVKTLHSLLPENVDELPPLLITTGENQVGDVLVEECPAPCQILHLLEEGGPRPLMFVLNANLLINLKIVSYGGRQCWCFGSTGLQALGQKELVFLLQCLPASSGQG